MCQIYFEDKHIIFAIYIQTPFSLLQRKQQLNRLIFAVILWSRNGQNRNAVHSHCFSQIGRKTKIKHYTSPEDVKYVTLFYYRIRSISSKRLNVTKFILLAHKHKSFSSLWWNWMKISSLHFQKYSKMILTASQQSTLLH